MGQLIDGEMFGRDGCSKRVLNAESSISNMPFAPPEVAYRVLLHIMTVVHYAATRFHENSGLNMQ